MPVGSVTISVDKTNQSKLDHIKKHIPELNDFTGDELTKAFFYYSIKEAATLFDYKENK